MKQRQQPPGTLMHYEYAAPSALRPRWPVPKEHRGDGNSCPHCGRTMVLVSEDHIFPQFLGGRRWIKSCKPCNDRFGYTIEASADEEIFTPHYVLLSAFGLNHIREGATWKRAFTREGNCYHLIGKGGTLQERLADPIITRNDQREIVGCQFPDYRTTKTVIRHAHRQGRRVEILRNT